MATFKRTTTMKYLLGLLLTFLLMASLARADQIPYSLVWTSISPDAGVFLGPGMGVSQVNGANFAVPLPLAGGLEEYHFTMSVDSNNSGIPLGLEVFGFCRGIPDVIQYPPGYVDDPNLAPIDRYPYDNCIFNITDSVSDPLMFRNTAAGYVFVPGVYGDVTIKGAPEPATLTFLLAGFGALVIRKRLR
jgi:hypothetical protein